MREEVSFCTIYCTAAADMRVHSTSLYHCRQCSIVLKPRSNRIDYTVVCFVTHDCSRNLRKHCTTSASWVWCKSLIKCMVAFMMRFYRRTHRLVQYRCTVTAASQDFPASLFISRPTLLTLYWRRPENDVCYLGHIKSLCNDNYNDQRDNVCQLPKLVKNICKFVKVIHGRL